jgi:hypothetical protein
VLYSLFYPANEKHRLPPLKGRQMAVVSARPALAVIPKQQDMFRTNQNQGQDHS